MGSLAIAAPGIAAGFAAVYGFDLWVHRGRVAGEDAEQRSCEAGGPVDSSGGRAWKHSGHAKLGRDEQLGCDSEP